MSLIQASDLVATGSASQLIQQQLGEAAREARVLDYGTSSHKVRAYGKKPIDFSKVMLSYDHFSTREELDNTVRWQIKSYEHAQHLASHPELFLPLVNGQNDSVSVQYAGVESVWSISTAHRFLAVSSKAMDRVLDSVALRDTEQMGGSRIIYKFADDSLSDNYIGDQQNPLLRRAWYSAKRMQMMEVYYTGSSSQVEVNLRSSNLFMSLKVGPASIDTVSILTVPIVYRLLEVYKTAPPVDLIKNQRQHLLASQANLESQEARVRQQLATKNFSVYWDTMKQRIRQVVPSVEVTAEQFATIPLQPQGTKSSRTWGIEVETVRAEMTSRPAGWESVYDGSLSNSSGSECNCGCDSCYDDDHCEDTDGDCYRGVEGEAREFVSPVLQHFNSDGLRSLCNDLPDNEEDSTPGIHVHVDGSDLTVTDIARLLVSYSAIAPLLKPLYHRKTYGYCGEMHTDNIQWWLGAARRYTQQHGSVPRPRDLCEDSGASRYLDVNVHSLAKHGTIEFRSMGPYYNYDHLVRWAWFVRELVNVSKLGLPQTTWTRCRSLLDVIGVLRKYGSEMPLDKDFINVDTSELSLSVSEE